MTSISYIEILLNRSMNNVEKLLYDKYKDNPKYEFTVDRNKNLKAVKQ